MHDAPPSSSFPLGARSRRVLAVAATALLASPLALLVPPQVGDIDDAPARVETLEPLPDGWARHDVELVARAVDLGHLGVHTHANWVVFDLPFDPTVAGLRHVRLAPRTTVRSDLGALRLGPLCLRTTTVGDVADPRWTKLTKTGGAGTRPFWEWDGDVPGAAPRAFVLSVPSRVANAAACWVPALTRRESWRLAVTWETAPAR